jgi:uncharacterized delta-60 repeat protein
MSVMSGPARRLLVSLVLSTMALVVPAAAGAGDPSPVVVEQPPPAGATRASFGDLVPIGDSRLLALAYTFPRPGHHANGRHLPSSYRVAELTTSGRLVRSFGSDGYTRPLRFGRRAGTAGRALALAREGRRIIVAGERETGRGEMVPLLVAYRADGRIDRAFGHGGVISPSPKGPHPGRSKGWDPGRFSDVAVRPGGGIVAVGVIRDGNRQAALAAAYRPDGKVDRSFGNNGRVVIPEREEWDYSGFATVLVLPDGKLLLAGSDDVSFGRMKLVRLDPDGRLDRTFGGGDGVVTPKDRNAISCCGESVLLASAGDGKILVAGERGGAGSSITLLRLHRDGFPDRSFGVAGVARFPWRRTSPGSFVASAITVRPDGRILIVGDDEVGRRKGYRRLPAVLGYLGDGKVDTRWGNRGVEILSRRDRGGLAAGMTTNSRGTTFVAGGIYGIGPKAPRIRPFLADLGDR